MQNFTEKEAGRLEPWKFGGPLDHNLGPTWALECILNVLIFAQCLKQVSQLLTGTGRVADSFIFFLFFSGINSDRSRIIRFQSLNDRDSAGHLHSINLRKFPGGRYNTCHFNFSGKIALPTQYVQSILFEKTLYLDWVE